MKQSPNSSETSDLDPELLVAVDEIHQRFSDGEHVSLEEYIARLPQHEKTLRQLFEAFQFMTAYADSDLQSVASPFQTQQRHKQLGEFTISREIGRGGMGIVYEAFQNTLGRKVALKVLPLAGLADERRLERFKNEARAVATLHHNHIVPVYSVGSDRGVHYLAMQFIDGPSLADVIRRLQTDNTKNKSPIVPAIPPSPATLVGPEPTEVPVHESSTHDEIQADISTSRSKSGRDYHRKVATWIERVADGLAHAHENGVVHRDVKPGNLLVDQAGNVWITDFGLCRLESDVSMTATGDMLGTLRYMSPEQISGDRVLVDHRTDIYSLGLTLFELLALRPAFPENDRAALLKQIAQSDPPPLRQIDERIPVELETIVLKATEKSPQDRYRSAAEMAADLHRFLEQRPILAKPPRLHDRALKWLRRHPGTATTMAAATVVLLLISSGFALALIQQQQATEQERDTARAERDEVDRQRKLVIAERDRANTALQLAITTMDEFFSEIGENWIAEDRAFSNYQIKMLYRAAEILPKIAGNYPRNQTYDRDAGLAYQRAGNVLMRVREFEQASDHLEKSKELLTAAVANGDEGGRIRRELAGIEHKLGQVALSIGQYSLAVEQFIFSRQQFTELKQEFPDDKSSIHFCTIKAAFSEYEELRLKSLLLQEDSLLERLNRLLVELEAIRKQGIGEIQDIAELIVKLRVLKSASLRRLSRYEDAQEACDVALMGLKLQGSLDQRTGCRTLVEARLEAALTQMEVGEFEAARENLETSLRELQESFLFDGTPKDLAFAAMSADGPGVHLFEPQAFTLYARIQSRLAVLKSRLGEKDVARELIYEARATCASEFLSDQSVAQFAYDLLFCAEIVPLIEPLGDTGLLTLLEGCDQCFDVVRRQMEVDPLHKSQYSVILAAQGQYWRAQHRHDTALEFFQRAHALQLEVAEQVPDHPMIVRRLEQLSRLIQTEQDSVNLVRASWVASYELKGSFLPAGEERYTPWSLALGREPDNNQIANQLFVVDGQNKRVLGYSTGGESAGKLLVQRGKWGVMGTYSTTIGPDANLYVVDGAARSILRFDRNGGSPLGVDSAPENAPATFVATGVGGLQQPLCITFDANGDLYVSSIGSFDGEPCHEIIKFHGPSSPLAGQPKQVFIGKTAGLRVPHFMAFGSDGHFYVADSGSHSLRRYDAKSGEALPAAGRRNADFVPGGLGGLKNPKAFLFDDVDGDNQPDLIVTSETHEILCFNSTNGNFKGVLIKLAGAPWDIEILNQKQMVVAVDNTPAQPGDVLILERP